MKLVSNVLNVVVLPFQVLFNGLLVFFGILAFALALMSAALPFFTIIILAAGHGDEILSNSNTWLTLGLSCVPIIIVLGILTYLEHTDT